MRFRTADEERNFFPRSSDAMLAEAADGRQVWVFANGQTVPLIAGGDTSPVAHPLGPPTVAGNLLTVDTMLQQPTRITAMIMDLSLQRFIADRIFASAGGVTGGAVVYDELAANELYLDRDVERVAPGDEFPLVTSVRRAPKVAEVEKWGGKFYTTDEARDRNDAMLFVNEIRKLTNTIIKKVNARTVEVIEAMIAGQGGVLTFVGNDWSAAIPNGSNPTAPALTPGGDLAKARLLTDQDELGYEYNIVIVNPVQKYEWGLFYGDKASQALRDLGFDEMYASNRVTAGTAYVAAEKQAGEMRVEQPLATETSREGAPSMRQRTWTQSSVRPVFVPNNPFAIRKITGL